MANLGTVFKWLLCLSAFFSWWDIYCNRYWKFDNLGPFSTFSFWILSTFIPTVHRVPFGLYPFTFMMDYFFSHFTEAFTTAYYLVTLFWFSSFLRWWVETDIKEYSKVNVEISRSRIFLWNSPQACVEPTQNCHICHAFFFNTFSLL